MGIYSTAHIVYGWSVPSSTWLVDDLESHIDEQLRGGHLGYLFGGGYDWDPSEKPLIITVGAAPSYSADEESEALPPDAFDYELGEVADRQLRQECRDRLGITPEGHAQWHLTVSTG